MIIKQVSVFLENKPGALHGFTKVLTENGIDMRALSLAETSEFGIARVIVDDPYKTATMVRDAGYVANITDVVGAEIPDVPGGLNSVLNILMERDINIQYMYAFLGAQNEAYMIFKVTSHHKAQDALRTAGIRLVDQDELADM